ncbi:MAG: hypothetical protein WBQ11_17340 [Isosphaeraceae bacterium]
MAIIRIKAAPNNPATLRTLRRDAPPFGFERPIKAPRQSASAVATTRAMPGVGKR